MADKEYIIQHLSLDDISQKELDEFVRNSPPPGCCFEAYHHDSGNFNDYTIVWRRKEQQKDKPND